MEIKCKICGMDILVEGDLDEGRNVLCPYCNQRFEFRKNEKASRIEVPKRESKSRGVDIGTWTHDEQIIHELRSIKRWLVWILLVMVVGQIGACSYLSDIKQKSYELRTY